MFLEFSGFLLCRQCGPIRWPHQASVCFGAWFDFVCAKQWIVELLTDSGAVAASAAAAAAAVGTYLATLSSI